jgi:hypothetical protein
MYKITNIESLGTEYSISDQTGKIVKSIQIIPHEEILEAALGKYDDNTFLSYRNYLEKSKEVLDGFDQDGMYSVLWFSSTQEEVVLSEIIEYAIKHNYSKVILEYLEETDES